MLNIHIYEIVHTVYIEFRIRQTTKIVYCSLLIYENISLFFRIFFSCVEMHFFDAIWDKVVLFLVQIYNPNIIHTGTATFKGAILEEFSEHH